METDNAQEPARDSARQAAQRYLERGWSVIPVPYRSKNPGFKRWEQMRLTCDELDRHFNGRPQNISVLLGEPSGWLIDVDLDHRRAVELAPQFLPPTALVFGRPGKPRSHWLYRVTAPLVTKKFSSRPSGMIAEVRSTGTHTIFPPSVHEIAEPITWEDERHLPAEVEPALLLESARRLAEATSHEGGASAENSRGRSQIAIGCIRPSNATGLLTSKGFLNRERESSRAISRWDGSNPRVRRSRRENREHPFNTAVVTTSSADGG
jgi:hypothetical protein